MSDKPLTKEDLIDALNQVIPPLAKEIGDIKKEVFRQGQELTRQGQELTRQGQELARQGQELDNKPDRDDVRQIVKEEVHKAFTAETFRLVPEKDYA